MSTPANSIAYFVRGQAANLALCVVSATTGNPISGGLSGLGAKVSKDDGNFAATTNAPVELLDTDGATKTGFVTLDLTAAEMTASKIVVQVYSSSSGAVTAKLLINPVNLTPFVGRYDAQTPIRQEQVWLDLHAYWWNAMTNEGALQTIKNPDGTTKATASIVEGDEYANRGKVS